MKCNKCGYESIDDSIFCGNCGNRLDVIDNAERKSFCGNCGAEIEFGADFCGNCGQALGQTEQIYEKKEILTPKKQTKKKRSILPVVISIISLVIILTTGAIVGYLYYNNISNDEDMIAEDPIIQPEIAEETENTNDTVDYYAEITDSINKYIDENLSQENISVAIVDNISDGKIYSQNSQSRYTAWGFYLPVYYAYGATASFNDDIAVNIMSSNVSLCNTNGNKAINALGGLTSLNQKLADLFNVSTTYYGRYFADTKATGDNYTCAYEAVEFLKKLNDDNKYTMLSNNPKSFKVDIPYKSVVYAQLGTENANVLNNLNLFAIIKGENSDYCVAILSRNGWGSKISELLQIIHNEMELIQR